ncbi:hypothetical protein GGR01_003865 [Acetobacter oeni]|nr:hypothetical protein [Acetobacter oeni]
MIRGQVHWLWRAVDQDGYVLDADFFCGCRPLCKSFLTHIDV